MHTHTPHAHTARHTRTAALAPQSPGSGRAGRLQPQDSGPHCPNLAGGILQTRSKQPLPGAQASQARRAEPTYEADLLSCSLPLSLRFSGGPQAPQETDAMMLAAPPPRPPPWGTQASLQWTSFRSLAWGAQAPQSPQTYAASPRPPAHQAQPGLLSRTVPHETHCAPWQLQPRPQPWEQGFVPMPSTQEVLRDVTRGPHSLRPPATPAAASQLCPARPLSASLSGTPAHSSSHVT